MDDSATPSIRVTAIFQARDGTATSKLAEFFRGAAKLLVRGDVPPSVDAVMIDGTSYEFSRPPEAMTPGVFLLHLRRAAD